MTRRNKTMKRTISLSMMLMIIVMAMPRATWALGTPEGTPITNQALASYNIGATAMTTPSNSTTTIVQELVNVVVTWQDISNVLVLPGDTDQALTFEVYNSGNGTEDFDLSATSGPPPDFTPILQSPALYADTNTNGVYDVGVDVAIAGSTISLLNEERRTVFVVNDIPSPPPALNDGDQGLSALNAVSQSGTGAGTTFPGGVIGTSGGQASDTGIYEVRSTVVDLNKSVDSITDPFGGSQPVPGAEIRYEIIVSVSGAGTANTMTVTDPIPADTIYSGFLSVDNGLATSSTVSGLPMTVTVDYSPLDSTNTPTSIFFGVIIQ